MTEKINFNKQYKNYLNKRLFYVLVVFIICASFMTSQHAFAVISVEWIRFGLPIPNNDVNNMISGDLFGIEPVLSLRVVDTDPGGPAGNGMTDDVIAVNLSSTTGDNIILNLNEFGGDTGVFTNNKVIFMSNNAKFQSLSDTATLTIADNSKIDGTPNDVLIGGVNGAFIASETTGAFGGIFIDLNEIDDTGVFIRKISLCNTPGCSNSALAILEASVDDTITIADDLTFDIINGYVVSNTSGNGAIIIEAPGTVTASYKGVDRTISNIINPPGRGGGGIVSPGLVVDSPLQAPQPTSSGCDGDCSPPTLGIDENFNRIVSDGFSFNGNPVDVELYYTPYPLITANVGEQNITTLKIYENMGADNISHVGLAFGLGEGESFNDSKATINLDISRDGKEVVSVYDPENALDNVTVTTEKGSCGNASADCLIVHIGHMFRDSLNFNMVATYVWDFSRNSWQNYYNHGIEIRGESLNPPKTQLAAFGTKEMRGLYELVQIDKREDIWQDEFGNLYHYHGNDRFGLIYSAPKELVYDKPTMHGCDRNCNWFEQYKLNEQLLAQITLNDKVLRGKVIQGEPPAKPIFHEANILQRSEDPVLQQLILYEQERASKLYNDLFDGLHP